jgi:hypothetical protein
MDLVEHLRHSKADVARTLFWRGRRGENTWRGVRDGNLKLVSRQEGSNRQEWLFDLASDEPEKSDLSKLRPTELARLRTLLSQWELEVKPSR